MKDRGRFSSKWGFIMACVGSAVGLANVWAFPYKLGENGGFTFMIPYLIFVLIFGRIGLAAENAVGRKYKMGPMGVFREAWKERGLGKVGRVLRWLPIIGTTLLAMGYGVVITYVVQALIDSINGSLMTVKPDVWFESISTVDYSVVASHLILMAVVFITMIKGTKGIEKSNKFMMPLFFVLFIILAIRIGFLDGASKGYKFIFSTDFSKLKDLGVWIAAMGQAFFSLSIVSTVMVVYGSYLSDDEDVVSSSSTTAALDTLAALLACFVMIPATFAFGFSPSSGPKLLFVVLPNVMQEISGGRIFAIILYIAMVFAGITSIQSMLDTVADAIHSGFPHFSKNLVLALLSILVLVVGIFIEPIAKWGPWMDFVTIYILPLSAIIGAITWFFVMKKEDLLFEINKSTKKKHGDLWYYIGKYVYVPLALILCFIAMRYKISF
ncbi:MAG: sodium-dependent transporter [Peptoniphilaceae bacterium]|nr:sodium-dependent transporter [Peptoniphilaceae bacterium]MDY6018595.1 sodium-dependent transporter [Anaerococcus sp.]